MPTAQLELLARSTGRHACVVFFVGDAAGRDGADEARGLLGAGKNTFATSASHSTPRHDFVILGTRTCQVCAAKKA